jgi:hypothetical protein
MKTIIIILGLALAPILITSCSSGKTLSGKADRYAWIVQRIDSGKFKIEVNQAYPMPGTLSEGVINLTSIYTLEIRNDSVLSWLPYYGRAYVAPMDSNRGGLEFTELYSNYKKIYSSKKGFTITFNAKTKEDNYRFVVEISSEGYASIGVTSDKRSFIRFSGQMVK